MAIFRVNKTDNFTVMSNYHLRDQNLTLKAKGLLSLMLSLPNEWTYSINGLVAICKESESAIKGALKELQEAGYLTIHKFMPNKTASKRIEYVYNIFELPQKQEGGFQPLENQPLENQPLENRTQLNTKRINTENKRPTRPRSIKSPNQFDTSTLADLETLLTQKLQAEQTP